jgi:CRISPR-associated exonuclease Cas4
VDEEASQSLEAGGRVEYASPIWSEQLGLIGQCDVMEFHGDGTIYPVEYKHGKRRKWLNDDLQLTAQAMCTVAPGLRSGED